MSSMTMRSERAICVDCGAVIPWLAIIWLFFQLADSMVRYYFGQLGVPFAIYSRDFICLAIACWAFYHAGLRLRPILMLGILAYGSLIGLYFVRNTGQVAAGLRYHLPFVAGAMLPYTPLRVSFGIRRVLICLYAAHVGSIVADRFLDLPWTGLTYEIGGLTIQGNREWSTHGVERLSGWSNMSAFAAVSALPLALAASFDRRLITRVLIWSVGTYALLLTTCKSAIIAWILLTPFLLLGVRVISNSIWGNIAWKGLLAAGLILLILFPGSAILGYCVPEVGRGWLNTSSLYERLGNVWPQVIDWVCSHGSPVTGRGIGGHGMPVQLLEPEIFTYWTYYGAPIDSTLLLLWAQFGFVGLCIPPFYCLSILLNRRCAQITTLSGIIAMGLLVSGIVLDVPMIPVAGACLGFAWSAFDPQSPLGWQEQSGEDPYNVD